MKHLASFLIFLSFSTIAAAAGTYADGDNRDNQKLLIEDQRVELALHQADVESRKERYLKLQEAYGVGAIPAASMVHIEHEMAMDPFQTSLLENKIRNTEAKIRAYEAYLTGKKLESLTADVESNRAGVAMYEAELKKSEYEVDYLKKRLADLKPIFEAGAYPWAMYHQATLETAKADLRRDGVQRKLAEQRRQLADAEAELKKFKPRR